MSTITIHKRFEINRNQVEVLHKISPRTRSIRLAIFPGGKIVITTPKSATDNFIQSFITKKAKWIQKKYEHLKQLPEYKKNPEEYQQNKIRALELAKSRLNFFNSHYNLKYKKVSIKNSKSLWGSCSKRGNLNFNYKIAMIPASHADYVIVHELCHLQEFNHSRKFWDLVSQTIPNHSVLRKDLKKYGLSFS